MRSVTSIISAVRAYPLAASGEAIGCHGEDVRRHGERPVDDDARTVVMTDEPHVADDSRRRCAS